MLIRKRDKFLLFNLLLLFLLFFSIQSTRVESKYFYNSTNLLGEKISNTNVILQESSLREQIKVKSLIDKGYNGSGIKIGIIDTGVNSNHSEFQNKIIFAKYKGML